MFVEEFDEYLILQEYSSGHLEHMQVYFSKHLAGKSFETPLELQKYVTGQKGYNNLIKAARVYLNFCEQHEKESKEPTSI